MKNVHDDFTLTPVLKEKSESNTSLHSIDTIVLDSRIEDNFDEACETNNLASSPTPSHCLVKKEISETKCDYYSHKTQSYSEDNNKTINVDFNIEPLTISNSIYSSNNPELCPIKIEPIDTDYYSYFVNSNLGNSKARYGLKVKSYEEAAYSPVFPDNCLVKEEIMETSNFCFNETRNNANFPVKEEIIETNKLYFNETRNDTNKTNLHFNNTNYSPTINDNCLVDEELIKTNYSYFNETKSNSYENKSKAYFNFTTSELSPAAYSPTIPDYLLVKEEPIEASNFNKTSIHVDFNSCSNI